MDIKIEGNPGTGNRFEEIHIEHAENLYNHVRKVENHYATIIEITFNIHLSRNGE